MRIGLIIYGSLDTLTGGYLYDRKLVEYLRSQGDSVEIISLPWRNYAAHLLDNFHFRLPVTDVVARRSRWSSTPMHLGAYRDQATTKQHLPWRTVPGSPHSRKYDILIQDELNHPSLLLANRGKHAYPIISLVHHLRCSEERSRWQNFLYGIVEKQYLRSVDGFIFNSRTTEHVVRTTAATDKPGLVAYPPTDRFGELLSEAEIIERAKSAELRILFLGNVIPRKGLHTLLQSVNMQPSTLRVDVVGSLTSDAEYVRRMQRFVHEKDLSSQVSFHSSLDKEPLIEKLTAAHVLVVPSSYEGYGIVYLEGMGFGLPAIGTTSGAANEIISDGVDGFLIEPGDARGLADKLKSLGEHRDALVRMSLAARARYLRQPKWEETAPRIRGFLLKQIDVFSV